MSSIFQNSFDDLSGDSSIEISSDHGPSKASHGGTPKPSVGNVPQSAESGSLARLGSFAAPSLDPNQQKNIFFLSLIEGRCRTQAAKAINKDRRLADQVSESHPEVVERARHLFAEMSKELHKTGVLPDEFAGQNLEKLRTQYLKSFDTILYNMAAQHTIDISEQNIHPSIMGSDVVSLSRDPLSFTFPDALARQRFAMAANPTVLQPPCHYSFMLNRQGNDLDQSTSSVYGLEYKEVSLLGTGGFGAVYKALNHVDNREYAIKKIQIPAAKLPLLNEADGVAKLLSEVRTLARLSHHNVVRYYHGWIETAPAEVRRAIEQDMSSHSLTRTLDTLSSQDHDLFESRFNELQLDASDDLGDDPFERSGLSNTREAPVRTVIKADQSSKYIDTSKALVEPHKSRFFRRPTSSTEEIERDETNVDLPGPASDIVLFIKMALHPMTLEDFLWGAQQKAQEKAIQHCFHTPICVNILLAILNGIQYIHNEGIVHRDLKPSNIFLSVRQGPTSDYEGAIDVTECSQCKRSPSNTHTIITPHIGDFGLAAELKDDQIGAENAEPMALAVVHSSQQQLRPTGTKFYCTPTNDRTICPKFDCYSLGVIAFEMITRFSTKSERAIVLQNLSNGSFPADFDSHEMAPGIRGMLCVNREERWTCNQVRKWLREILANI